MTLQISHSYIYKDCDNKSEVSSTLNKTINTGIVNG